MRVFRLPLAFFIFRFPVIFLQNKGCCLSSYTGQFVCDSCQTVVEMFFVHFPNISIKTIQNDEIEALKIESITAKLAIALFRIVSQRMKDLYWLRFRCHERFWRSLRMLGIHKQISHISTLILGFCLSV